MKFKDYVYKRPEVEDVRAAYDKALPLIRDASDAQEQIAAIDEVMELRKELYSMREIVKIRYAMNTADEYYCNEDAFWAEFNPYWSAMDAQLYKVLKDSTFTEKLKERYSAQFFELLNHNMAVFSEEIVEDIKKENILMSESIRLSAGNVMIDGKEQPYPKAVALFSSVDRKIRQKGFEAYEDFYEKREAEFDKIFNELVQVRRTQARKLGFFSYVEMAFRQRQRVGYTLEDIRKFREDVKKYIVPINKKIREEQRQRLEIKRLHFYDEEIMFTNPPALRFDSEEELKEITRKAMDSLGKEAYDYYEFMLSHELLDLYARPNKALGGMAYFIPKPKTPFIETNFSNVPKDVEVYSHELGHAFQLYMSPVMPVLELLYPASDACEVHSMGMEFFFWKSYDVFFAGDINKQKYMHLASCLTLLAWCCIIDEFQEEVYSHAEYGPEDYKKVWKKLEEIYLPYRCYGEDSFFNKGTFWYKQLHLFQSPFYYIDYALAQTSALQLFIQINEYGEKTAWENYLKLCCIGGWEPYLEMIKQGGIQSPFEEGLIEKIGEYSQKKLKELLNSLER